MAKKSIKIVIAGRNYPLTINEEEENLIRDAVQTINSNIQRLQESYAVKDMQDLLAMTSLQLATRSNNDSSNNDAEGTNNSSAIKDETLLALKSLSEKLDV